MARRIRLSRFAATNVDYEHLGAFRLRVEASDAEGMEPYVFVYRRDLQTPYSAAAPNDTFFAVASPVDMAEYPPLEPDPSTTYPFFRLDFIEIDLRSTRLAASVWYDIQHDVRILLEALDRLDELSLAEQVVIGGVPDELSSSESA